MKPALSLILFTTLAGAAQGVVVVLALATLAGAVPAGALAPMLWVVTGMLLLSLVASFFHLGHPLRAWRAVLMWRTSWMSREVIVLPAFIALVAGWAVWATLDPGQAQASRGLAVAVLAGAFLLWYCTGMIYTCIRFIREWAHPLTVVNYTTLGLASGAVTVGALSALAGQAGFAAGVAPWALAATALAWITRGLSLRRNARLKPVSSVQSATGIRSPRVVQKAMGMTGGSFNTREFFHGASMHVLRSTRVGFQVLAFALPIALLAWASHAGSGLAWSLTLISQAAGLLAERWFFFAQANHPQNLYYQTVS